MKKIMAFIMNEKKQLLLLRNNPKDIKHGGDFWYVVTGNFEVEESNGIAVAKREIKEETNLEVLEIFYLNWIFEFKHNNQKFIEYAYLAIVKDEKIILNEESIDFEWCDLKTFLEKINWYGNFMALEKVLELAINKGLYFKKEKKEKYF